MPNINQSNLGLRKKMKPIKGLNSTNQKKIVPNSTAFMNAFYALVAQLHVHPIGGMVTNILDQLLFNRLIVGLLIHVMTIKPNVLKK